MRKPPHPTMVEKASFFSWERKPLVSSPNLSFLKVKIHFVNEKLVFLSQRERGNRASQSETLRVPPMPND
jgi:hypothetical protein